MTRLHLIRHGRAAAGYGAERNPGLDDHGRAEAMAVAETFAQTGPLPILVSPLRRCRETAAPLEALWQVEAVVEPGIAEVAAPTDDLTGRSEWLRWAMSQRWTELEHEPQTWRTRLLDVVGAIGTDAVLVTHFIAINAVIGAATGDDRVLIERLANGSITTIESDGGVLTLVAAGMHGSSEVL
jgi:broad specificity phosphatase PhoE